MVPMNLRTLFVPGAFAPVALALLIPAVVACSGAATRAAPDDAGLAQLEREYVVASLARYPVVATYLGAAALDPSLAAVDGQLRDWSPAAIEAEDRMLMAFRDRLQAFDATRLSPARRIDRDVALSQIEFLLRQHARKYAQRAIDTYVDEPFRGVDWQLQGMSEVGAGRWGTEAEWRRVVERLGQVRPYLRAAQDQIRAGIAAGNTADWRMIRAHGVHGADANAEYFAITLPGIARERLGGSAALIAEVALAGSDAAAAYREFRDFALATFVADDKRNDDGYVKAPFRGDRYAFGQPEYDWAIKNNLRLDATAAQLYEQAWPVVERTQAEMAALAQQIATARGLRVRGPVVRAVMDQLDLEAPKSDEETVRWYREAGERMVDYARRTGLFDVPADYRLEVFETPPPLRASIDGAAYYPAPPFKATGVGRFYLTTAGGDPAKLAQHNRYAVADLAAHEGFPGHDWYYKVMSQHREQISLVRWVTPGAVEDSSSMWQDSLASEGWALYSEALMGEPQPNAPLGFYKPEERLYQLQGQLYRDLRVRVDTGLHTGRLTFDQAVDLFSQVVDFQPGSCRDAALLKKNAAKRASCDSSWRAIFRYSKWPTQAITYRLGKDAIRELRAAAQQRLGDGFSAKRFHVEYMKQGSIPAGYFGDELLRALER
jgi:uncharacterized protein (DUF885 family)